MFFYVVCHYNIVTYYGYFHYTTPEYNRLLMTVVASCSCLMFSHE